MVKNERNDALASHTDVSRAQQSMLVLSLMLASTLAAAQTTVVGPPNTVVGPPRTVVGPPPAGPPPNTVVGPPNTVVGPPNTVVGPPRTVVGPPPAGPPPNTVVGPPNTVVGPPRTVVGPPPAVVGPPNTVVGPPVFGGAPVFDSLDADRDGRISAREANANRATSLGFGRADADRDGVDLRRGVSRGLYFTHFPVTGLG